MTPEHYQNQKKETARAFLEQYGLQAYLIACNFNVRKYLDRFPYKGAPVQDLKKAGHYINMMIEALETNEKERSSTSDQDCLRD